MKNKKVILKEKLEKEDLVKIRKIIRSEIAELFLTYIEKELLGVINEANFNRYNSI